MTTRQSLTSPSDSGESSRDGEPTTNGYYIWLMIRLTGLLLSILVLGHFAVTHIVTDVADTDAGFVAKRWGSALWITWDSMMLAAAFLHGGAGIWMIIGEYARDHHGKTQLRVLLVIVSSLLFVIGVSTITLSVIK